MICLIKNKRVKFLLYRQIHRRDRFMAQLFYQDNKRYEWIKEKLNMKDYQLKTAYPYKRQTKYEKFVEQIKLNAEELRAVKLDQIKDEFEQEKVTFYADKALILDYIKKEIKS